MSTPPAQPSGNQPAGSTSGFAYPLPGGAVCRSWDEFLIVSSQRWEWLRDELVSGRLEAFVTSIGRRDLAPDPRPGRSPDERLDDWLAGLPTTRSSLPELDVHPRAVTLRRQSGRSMPRATTVRISNIGYRILRGTVRVEPPDASWIRLGTGEPVQSFTVLDGLDLSLRLIDDSQEREAALVFESSGGSARLPVSLSDPKPEDLPTGPGASGLPAGVEPWDPSNVSRWVARQSIPARLAGWALAAVGLRLLIEAADRLIPTSETGGTGLLGPTVVLAVLGALVTIADIWRRQAWDDLVAGAFVGMYTGLVIAALGVAFSGTLEFGASLVVACLLWALLGLGLAGISIAVAPPEAEVQS